MRDTEGKAKNNFFKAMGLDYVYIKDGHDYEELIDTFSKVKDREKPIVVHIHTTKGKGYEPAEKNKEMFHWGMPFEIETGKSKFSMGTNPTYENITAEFLLDTMKKDPTVVAITSGTPFVFGFSPDRRKEAGKQFVDVGIAEEHAVAFASGIGANGGKAVYGVYSTFIQRTYDQISQDLCINNNPATILVSMASVYGMNDITHLGLYDIGLLSNIPNLVYLAPTTKEEYLAMLNWSINQRNHPVAIRIPAMGVIESGVEDKTDYSILNKYEVIKEGKDVAVIALGSFFPLGQKVIKKLLEEKGINGTLINPKYITGLDEELLENLKKEHKLVITLEDGILDGGFGEKISRFFGPSDTKVINYGVKKEVLDRYNPDELMERNRLTDAQIVEDIIKIIK